VTATETLFPDVDFPTVEPEPEPRPSTDRKRTLRQHADIAAGRHPLTRGPIERNGETCGTCVHRIRVSVHGRNWPKCDQQGRRFVTRSATTDVRAFWPACFRWEASE
jgi:hypothetical protein